MARSLTALVVLMLAIFLAFYGMGVAMDSLHERYSEPPVSDADFLKSARAGVPIVIAIHAYQHKIGLWPEHLEDLTPEFLSPSQISGWNYGWSYSGWLLNRWVRESEARVEYVDSPSPHWIGKLYSSESEKNASLNLPQPFQEGPLEDPADIDRRMEAELLRRTANEPKEEDHWRQLTWFYVRAGRFLDARSASARHAAATHP